MTLCYAPSLDDTCSWYGYFVSLSLSWFALLDQLETALPHFFILLFRRLIMLSRLCASLSTFPGLGTNATAM